MLLTLLAYRTRCIALQSSVRNFASSVRQVVINSSRTRQARSPSIQYTTIKSQRHTQARHIVGGAKFHAM